MGIILAFSTAMFIMSCMDLVCQFETISLEHSVFNRTTDDSMIMYHQLRFFWNNRTEVFKETEFVCPLHGDFYCVEYSYSRFFSDFWHLCSKSQDFTTFRHRGDNYSCTARYDIENSVAVERIPKERYVFLFVFLYLILFCLHFSRKFCLRKPKTNHVD